MLFYWSIEDKLSTDIYFPELADNLIYLHGKINDTVFHTNIGLEYFPHLLIATNNLITSTS